MADIKISELEPTTDLEGLYTIGSDKNNLSKKVSLQFLKDAANYANEQGDYAKEVGDTVNGNVGVNDYPAFSASASYSAGDIVRYNGTLYQFTANHAASAWNGNDVKATSINAITSGKLTELESEVVKENEISNSNSILYFREKRNEGKGLNALGEYANSTDLFTLFVPCDSENFSAIKVRGIGSSYFAAIAFRNKYNNVIRVEYAPTFDEYVFSIPKDTTFCFVSYYTDTKAESEHLPKFNGVTLYQKGNSLNNNLSAIMGEALISENKIVEYSDYYNSHMFFIKHPVNVGDCYKITGRNTTNTGVLYALVDADNNVKVRANKDETDVEIIIPEGVSYIYFSASLYYPSSFEKIGNSWKAFNNDYLIYRGNRLQTNGFFGQDAECAVSERIPLLGIKKIIAPIFPSKVAPCVVFYNKADKFVSSVINNSSDYALTPKIIDVPTGAEYMRYCVYVPWGEQSRIFTDAEICHTKTGRLTNAIVKKTNAIKEVVYNAADIDGFDISMCPTMASDYNGNLFFVAEKRANHADTGIMHIYFARKDENGWSKKIILESTDRVGRYMNPIIFKDENGVLGVQNRLYCFAAKFFDINTYVAEFTNTDDADFIYIYSDNNGETWSKENSLKQHYPNDVVLFVSSPGEAIVLQNGTFAMPGYVVKSPGGSINLFRAGIITYNKDNGWLFKTIDGIGNNDTENECSICEYGVNSIMVNVRNFVGTRSVYFTSEVSENGYDIKAHQSNQTFLTYDDYGCQGSILTWNSYCLLTHVDVVNVNGRQNLCVFGSYQGMTYLPLLYISMNEIIGGYANLYAANGKLYCVYESGDNRTEVSYVEITNEINDAISNCRYAMLNNDSDILQAVSVRNNL